MTDKPGLCLKEKVRNQILTPQDALNLLREKDPVHASGTKTYRWLFNRGAR